jgi:hypothetical protein
VLLLLLLCCCCCVAAVDVAARRHCHPDMKPLHAMHKLTGVRDIHPNPMADPLRPLPIVRCGSGMLHGMLLHLLLLWFLYVWMILHWIHLRSAK